jgi:6-phosphogluconolactonase
VYKKGDQVMPNPIITIEPTNNDTVTALANWLALQAREAIADHGAFLLALSGGTTPKQLYIYLAAHQDLIDWTRTVVYFSDERDVPPTHPESNFGMAYQALIQHLTPPAQAIHRWHTEYETALALAD